MLIFCNKIGKSIQKYSMGLNQTKMDEEKTNKNLAKFACEKCGFITSNKFNYNTHLLTAKHKKTNFGLANPANLAIQEKECSGKFACKCGKKISTRVKLDKTQEEVQWFALRTGSNSETNKR